METAHSRRGFSFRNLGVTTKIVAAVAIAGVAALVIGIVGLTTLSSSAAATQKMYKQSSLGVDLAQEMRFQLETVRFDGVNKSFLTDPAQKTQYANLRVDARNAFNAAGQQLLSQSNPTAATRAVANTALADMAKLTDLTNQLDTLNAVTNAKAWLALRDGQITPLTNKIVGELNGLVGDQVKSAAAAAKHSNDDYHNTQLILIIILVVGLIVALGAGLVVARSITGALKKVRRVAEHLATGDLTGSTGVDQRDEVGITAAALDTAMVDLRKVLSSVVGSADAVAASSEQLSASSKQIAASASETSVQSGVVSSAADEISQNVARAAAGAEEMGASIREISQNASEAAQIAATAVVEAESTNATVVKLGDSSREIGNVVKVIASIAEQTNLLALNATIEAARAGEAGKGFAVVASEVKDLAQETARATEEVSRRVETIQADTAGAVEAIGRISSIIGSINEFQLTIASAVEQQSATTNEMSRSVHEAATGSTEIAANINGVSTAANSTTDALGQTRLAVDDLSRMAAELRQTVARFTY